MKTPHLPIVLASSSLYRRELLSRIVKSFDQYSPEIDESQINNETAKDLVLRLAESKAREVAKRYPAHLIIASDQVAVRDKVILGKPLSVERAERQLAQCSGNRVEFITSLCLLNTTSGNIQLDVDRVSVQFRSLTPQEIQRYIEHEQPLDCAGSFKCEGLGIALFESMEMQDPTSLIGLPLIKLTGMLKAEGVNPLLIQA